MDPQRVLRALSAVASRQEFGAAPSGLFQKTFGAAEVSSTAKLLASDLIHLRALHDSDWDIVRQNLKDGLSSADPEAQILALQILPSMPPLHLTELVLKGNSLQPIVYNEIGEFVVVCLGDGSPVLRSGAVAFLGHLHVQLDVVKSLTHHPDKQAASVEYWRQMCERQVDPDDQVAGTAFSAVRQLLDKNSELREKDPGAPWTVLMGQWSEICYKALQKNLAAVLHRASKLDVAGLVSAVEVLYRMAIGTLSQEIADSAKQKLAQWSLSAILNFLRECLTSNDAAVVHQAAGSLLELCQVASNNLSQSWMAATVMPWETWASGAILVLENLLESKETVPARGDILSTITRHLSLLQLSEICVVARRLLQSISALPRSADRTRTLMHLWRAVLECDLKLRKIQHSRGEAIPGASLQSLLECPFFAGVVQGHQKQNVDFLLSKAITKASYPAYKQELVCSLMEVVMEHAKSFDMEAVFPARTTRTSEEPPLQSAILSDIQTDVVDWFAASVVALYLTQACLGWDNIVAEGYYGLTLPADLWLQQLQLTSQTLYTILGHYDIHFLTQLQSLGEEQTSKKTGKMLKTLMGEAFEIQKLMKKMVFFWSFLNGALKPRVLWVVAHHIELPDRVDDVWNYLTDGLKDLLIIRPTEATKRQHDERMDASKQGSLGPSNGSVYSAKASEESKRPIMAFNQSEVALEGMTYRLPEFYKYYERVSEIAKLLKTVCQHMLEEDFLTVDMFDQCRSVQKQLDYLTEHRPEAPQDEAPPSDQPQSTAEEGAQTGSFLPVPLSVKTCDSFPFSNSSSLALISKQRSKRHRSLRLGLQRGIQDVTTASVKKASARVPPVPERPTAVDLAAAVGGLNLTEDDSEWRILTGQGDPIELSIRHQVDAFSRTLEIEIRAENKMGSSDITDVIISFAIEGPVAADREGLIVWYPEKLPAHEPAAHRFELSLAEFGAIEIQPFMDVALQGSEDEMPSLSCSAYSIHLMDLLVPVSLFPSAKAYFQEVSSWPESLNTTAVCRWPGTQGAMQLLSALHQPYLKKIWPDHLQSLTVFQAVYLLQTFNDHWISLSITGQLVDLQRMGLAAWAVSSDELASGNKGYYLCKCTFASLHSSAIASIRGQTAELLSDLSSGGLVLGLDPGVGRPPPAPPIHPECYVELRDTQPTQFLPDLQSLALAEWKRLNHAV